MRALFFLLFSISFLICTAQQMTVKNETNTLKKPKNIILLIGDGTGLSQISASQFFNENPSNFDRFPVIGLIKTSAANSLITDSAAGATAFASGIKSYNGAIGVSVDSTAVPSIVEQVSERGLSTGLVSTSSITHATPACFYAHVKSRELEEDIASFLVTSEIDFFAGGGLKFFSQRSDGKDLIEAFKKNGFSIDTTSLKMASTNKQGFLLADDGMPKMLDGRGDFLPNATQMAIEQLSQNEQGFFLMIEGSQIDWGGHANDADYLISELIDFDLAIGIALDFAKLNGETLVIVTADHETGGFTLANDGRDYNKIKATFSTNGHSATMVPVFAKGPGAALFGGIYENTRIYHKMMELFNR
jgi:alkaline phosphatase